MKRQPHLVRTAPLRRWVGRWYRHWFPTWAPVLSEHTDSCQPAGSPPCPDRDPLAPTALLGVGAETPICVGHSFLFCLSHYLERKRRKKKHRNSNTFFSIPYSVKLILLLESPQWILKLTREQTKSHATLFTFLLHSIPVPVLGT